MLELSDIQSSPEELQDYYAQLRAQHITPAWIGGGISVEPRSEAVPYVWHWRDLRPQAMRAAELVGTAQAERRVLRLTNPELRGIASNTLVANIQIVMPGEIARAHRHSGAALRLIIEGRGGYTVVNGERVPMSPGDLVLTPNWSWHDHANDTDAPMIWLDGLDTPLVRMLEAGFYEEYHQERQDIGAPVNASEWYYPITEMRAALERLAATKPGEHRGGDHPRVHQPADRRAGDADDRLPYAAAAPWREDAGASPCLLHQLSRGGGCRLLGGGGPAVLSR
jgi:gentisate 1,2-dioxygenase